MSNPIVQRMTLRKFATWLSVIIGGHLVIQTAGATLWKLNLENRVSEIVEAKTQGSNIEVKSLAIEVDFVKRVLFKMDPEAYNAALAEEAALKKK